MAVQFYGKASNEELEHLQDPFKEWLERILCEWMPEGDFVVVLRGYLHYDNPMPRMRVIASALVPTDILIEVFPISSGRGLCFALYLPEEVKRAELMLRLRISIKSFS